jgi:hypothetical protein
MLGGLVDIDSIDLIAPPFADIELFGDNLARVPGAVNALPRGEASVASALPRPETTGFNVIGRQEGS